MIAALAVFVACKQLGMHRTRDEMLGMAASIEVDTRLFYRNLLRLKQAGKKSRDEIAAGGAAAINAALSALRDVLGPGDWLAPVSLVHARVARALVGLRADSAAAVVAYLSAQLISPSGVPLTALAGATRFRPASLYNATKRVLRKLGIVIEGPMSKARVGAVLRSRLAIGGGVVKESPVPVPVAVPAVPMSAPAIVSAEQAAGPVPARRAGARPPSPAILPATPALAAAVPRGRALRKVRHGPRVVPPLPLPLHVQVRPVILEFIAPRGRACRSARSLAMAARRAWRGPTTWHGSPGPPIAAATGA
ncbi:MAG: hypothetical protein Q6373_009430 [Candidatus Sigynarchaeota archaeon]